MLPGCDTTARDKFMTPAHVRAARINHHDKRPPNRFRWLRFDILFATVGKTVRSGGAIGTPQDAFSRAFGSQKPKTVDPNFPPDPQKKSCPFDVWRPKIGSLILDPHRSLDTESLEEVPWQGVLAP
ncbi:hypothetical protein ZHAS_00017239 [Anopheles sinensis]|uniref:Uncharacterized protein n=1 Tax=Anopheles sinensis TaxID=74873 RepID=A0A084WG89_ANOSI|nr:hypothetical protein ZHAS_00017239 [Anopheles sinensis]